MRNLDDIADDRTSYEDESQQFFNERLVGTSKDEWPSRIDRAALDVLYGVAIGSSQTGNDFGGTIGQHDFGEATGKHYAKGLTTLADDQSNLPQFIELYKNEHGVEPLGELVFRLNQLRHELEQNLSSTSKIQNLNRAVEALIDKIATSTISGDITRQSLHRPESVTDAMVQLFSDPSISEYALALTETVDEISASESFLERLDAPYMTTPLWRHQREALEEWLQNDCKGYVDMATATGKTVLGLATLALLYGKLHPKDMAEIDSVLPPRNQGTARVLVVAGQELILEQWQSELDEHLNIPRERTQVNSRIMDFAWGTVEFRTAQDLFSMELLNTYDLTILDEAHRYSRGGQTGGWRNVLDRLMEECDAFLAMSGSIDTSWQGDSTVRRILEDKLHECKRFPVDEAREAGVIADFEWDIYYAHAAVGESLKELVKSTKTIKDVYDEENHKIRADELHGQIPPETPSEFETLTDLRSFSQSKKGATARDSSSAFDELATSAFTRRPKRWQLSPPVDTLVNVIDQHAPEQQCVVLVQSYEQAQEIGDAVADRYGDDLVLVPKSSATEQFSEIDTFKKKDRGVIIGPANVLGIGVDLPNAEVAINISKGGVNAQLIQRIGRVLRDPRGNKEAQFYQIVTVPSDTGALLPGEDGRRLLRRASEFRALGARLRQLPGYLVVDDETAKTLAMLEHKGAEAVTQDHRSIKEIVEDEVAQAFLGDLRDRIAAGQEHSNILNPPTLINFRGAKLDRHSRPVAEAVATHKKNPTTEPTPPSTESKDAGPAFSPRPKSSHTIEIDLTPPLYRLITHELNSNDFASLDELIDDIVGTHISSHLNGNDSTISKPNSEFTVILPPQLETIIELNITDTDETVEDIVKEALYSELELESEIKTLSVSLSSGLHQIVETMVDTSDSYGSASDIVEEALNIQLVK